MNVLGWVKKNYYEFSDFFPLFSSCLYLVNVNVNRYRTTKLREKIKNIEYWYYPGQHIPFVQFLFVFSERECEQVLNNKTERKNQEYRVLVLPRPTYSLCSVPVRIQ